MDTVAVVEHLDNSGFGGVETHLGRVFVTFDLAMQYAKLYLQDTINDSLDIDKPLYNIESAINENNRSGYVILTYDGEVVEEVNVYQMIVETSV